MYQLAPEETESDLREIVSLPLRGRLLFDQAATYNQLSHRFNVGAVVKSTGLTEQFDYEAFQELYGPSAQPLFLIDETGSLMVFTSDRERDPRPGQTLISLVDPTGDDFLPNNRNVSAFQVRS